MSWRIIASVCMLVQVGLSAMGETFVRRDEVAARFAHDKKFIRAIRKAESTLDNFQVALANPQPNMRDFMVSVLTEVNGDLVPVGIAVQSFNNDEIVGLRCSNSMEQKFGDSVLCHISQIIDWRYSLAYECVGGHVFKELFRRQRRDVSHAIRSGLPFLVERLPGDVPDAKVLPLYRAIATHDMEMARQLLDKDPRLSDSAARMPVGFIQFKRKVVAVCDQSPLEYCARYGSVEMLELLKFEQSPRNDKQTSVFAACQSGNHEVVRFAIAQFEDPNVTNWEGSTALISAIEGLSEFKTVSELIDVGVDVNLPNKYGRTPIFHANTMPICELLLNAGARLDFISTNGENCVENHLAMGRKEVAQRLLEKGARQPRYITHDETDLSVGRSILLEYANENSGKESNFSVTVCLTTDFGFVLPVKVLSDTR